MAVLLSIVLTAVVARIVAAEEGATCGNSTYFPSQYTCFDDSFLCPIINDDIYLRCGDACYSASQYSCANNTLAIIPQGGSQTQEDCGDAQFYPSQAKKLQYVCIDGDFLCPIINGAATLRCGDACYAPSQYNCANNQLFPTTPPECVPEFGSSEVCTDQGCLQLLCCPGLFSVATKCRDPCELAPSTCTNSARDTDCVPDFGDSQVCNEEGCFQLTCCPGLISVADLCRDPCDVAPSSCANSARDTDCVPEFGDSQVCNDEGCFHVGIPATWLLPPARTRHATPIACPTSGTAKFATIKAVSSWPVAQG
ncbi:carbohydrate binding-domain-containing protein [Mycena capillaripes]|nr:carbohydrate binding-domain-containing protein [Mycena capillaripes]